MYVVRDFVWHFQFISNWNWLCLHIMAPSHGEQEALGTANLGKFINIDFRDDYYKLGHMSSKLFGCILTYCLLLRTNFLHNKKTRNNKVPRDIIFFIFYFGPRVYPKGSLVIALVSVCVCVRVSVFEYLRDCSLVFSSFLHEVRAP